MNYLKSIVVITFMSLLMSCNSELSLQKYIVNSKEKAEFTSIDLPSSILKFKNGEVSEDVEKTLKTIQKVNFLALQLTDSTKELYTSEKEKVSIILKNPAYKQLVKVHKGKGDLTINYLGDDTNIDEVVIFGSENSKGFALIRVLGKNMNPADILKMTKNIQFDENSKELGQIGDLIKNMY